MTASLALIAFAMTLAVVIGQRLSSEAMAVMVGVVAGVAASIPTSLLVSWFALRMMRLNERPAPPAEPRIIVIQQTPTTSALPPYPPHAMASSYPSFPDWQIALARPSRHFTVIGADEQEIE
jgi:hypothetical protein